MGFILLIILLIIMLVLMVIYVPKILGKYSKENYLDNKKKQ